MTIHCAYLSGIEAHLFRLAAERAPGRGLRMIGLPARVADQTVRAAAATLKRMGIDDAGTLIRCEREDPDAPPLDEDARIRGADLPAVLAVLGVCGVVGPDRLERAVAAAELDPSRPRGGGTPCVGIRGAAPIAERAELAGLDLVVALDNGAEAAAECPRTTAAATAEEVVDILTGRRGPEDPPPGRPDGPTDPVGPIWGIAAETLRGGPSRWSGLARSRRAGRAGACGTSTTWSRSAPTSCAVGCRRAAASCSRGRPGRGVRGP